MCVGAYVLRYGRNDEELRERQRWYQSCLAAAALRRSPLQTATLRRSSPRAYTSLCCPVSPLFSSATLTLHVTATFALVSFTSFFLSPAQP